MYGLYTALAATAFTVGYAPAAAVRRVVRGVPVHLRERLGYAACAVSPTRTGWVHAVSVGEAITAAPLITGLRHLYPDLPLVVTTVTETGARIVRDRYAGQATHRFFPIDVPGAVRRAVSAINPAFLISIETELWPNMLRHLAQRHVPIMIANGRLSDRSFPRYRLVRPFMRRVLDCVTVLAMQSDEDARRVMALGARPERVFVTGNLKHDAVLAADGGIELWRHLLGLRNGERVWIAGSTHRGEDEAALEAHRVAARDVPGLTLILAPRHPERVPDVVRLASHRGWTVVRRSELPRGQQSGAVIVVDTVGELSRLYAIAEVVFVGGSLVPAGGHNLFEPALHRKPVLFGPHTENFREATALLTASGGGRCVADADELAREVRRLLADPGARAALGQAAYDAVAARHGSVRETLDLVARFLGPKPR